MSTVDTNPLLKIEFRVPFDRIRAEDVEPAVEKHLQRAQERIDRIIALEGPRNFENTMLALDDATEELEYAVGVVRHLESVATYPELRAAYNAAQPKISAFYSSLPLNEALWNAIKSYAATDDAKALTGPHKRYLEKTLASFRRHGADLDAAGKARMAELDVELAKLTTKFSENVLDSTNAFELVITGEAQLSGLPESAREAARENARSKGIDGWRFTLQAPSFLPLVTYSDLPELREKVYRAYHSRATAGDKDNRPLLNRILELRREKAALLGYPHFAALVLEDRMAKSGERAREFVDKLRSHTEEPFRREQEELLAFRRSLEGENAPELEPWDVAYYAEKQRQAFYGFDEEELRPYFPVESVVAGMYDLVQRVFGIRVQETGGVPAWDANVKYYDIYDEAGGEWLGGFYSDFYPRENKRGGAWMDSFITGGPSKDRFEPHLGFICGNMTPPVGDKPALLTHREVETIFHEFGHLLHHCLSRAEIRGQAGTSVAWDFVELPSQIMENWCWEREALDLFARHYQTRQPIPEDLFNRMKRARNFRSASAHMRQLGFATVDLCIHVDYDPARDGDLLEYARRLFQQFTPGRLREDYAMLAGFTHLFASSVGYAAGYYSYKWAEVLDADAFTRFRSEGIFNRETGRQFRDCILSRGDSADPSELYRSFMGRDPDLDALLQRSGLLRTVDGTL